MQTAEKNKKFCPLCTPPLFKKSGVLLLPLVAVTNSKAVGVWSKTTADCRLSPELSVSVRKNPFRTAGSQRSDLQTAGWSWGNRPDRPHNPDRHRGEDA